MYKHPRLTEARISNTLTSIQSTIYGSSVPLRIEAHHVGGEPIGPKEAVLRDYTPFLVGDRWGAMWDTTWFRFSGAIPHDWKGREVVALIRLGGSGNEGFTTEGLVWQNFKPVRAINVHRADVPLAAKANGGEHVLFHVEAAANPNAQEYNYNMLKVEAAALSFTLRQADIACFNREAFDLFNDFRVVTEAMLALPEDSAGRGQLLYALNNAVNIFDAKDSSTIQRTRKELEQVLARHNGDSAHRISAIGHAHIDTAWLWPLRETIRKCARTFSTALAYMEEYPDYVFACSQPQQYAWMKAFYPSIFEGIKKAIKRGQWEAIGSMWIEADCNLAGGESLIRQILHGKNFFLDEFGIETCDVWLPDVFGYSASMPQIMQKSGITSFLTQKISWNKFNKFPHHTFLWEGIDGTRIFTHFPPADDYNANFTPAQLVFNSKNFREHDRASRSLYIYGYGDGGGGPTKEMLETAKRVKDFEGLPRIELEKVSGFFAKAKEDAKDLPVWVGELYLELHRGTYTTQARNKRGNRKSEFLLREAEFFDTLAGAFGADTQVAFMMDLPERAVYDVIGTDNDDTAAALLNRAWKLLLLNQFHDIIPGSSINWVYRDSDRDYATIRSLGGAVLDAGQHALTEQINTSGYAQPVAVFNSCSHSRSEVITLPNGEAAWVTVPGCGYSVIDSSRELPPFSGAEVTVAIEDEEIILANGLIRLAIDKDGFLSTVFDLRANRHVLEPGKRGNVLELHKDHPVFWDAWDVDIFYKETREELAAVESIEIIECTSLRATVKVRRKVGNSSFTQRIILRAGSARIDFATEVDWQEEHRFLRVAFPANVRSSRATFEIQYGHTERPTHYNTSWDLARFEVCAQKWIDLSESDYGVALLNDCKYGHDVFGNVMHISLLRAPTAPDPTADLGQHEFVYSLLPHPGNLQSCRVIEEAYDLNIPLSLIPLKARPGTLPPTQSFFEFDRPGVMIEAIKKAEKEDAIIVRMYEAYGSRGSFTLRTSLPVKMAFTADLLERTIAPIVMDGGEVKMNVTPFEIITLKFVC